jgi:hypothetical protein
VVVFAHVSLGELEVKDEEGFPQAAVSGLLFEFSEMAALVDHEERRNAFAQQ